MARAVHLHPKQELIVRTLDGPVFVSAGAGSGKTFTLTERVLWALTPGSKPRERWADPQVPEPFCDSIDQVLAITFTEKAAAELKERIRGVLVDAGMADEAERVDDAWISTIHGMCSRIIRAHALDLDVDPAYAVAGYADDLKRLAVEHVVRRALADDAEGAGRYDALLGAFELEGTGASRSVSSVMDILSAIMARAAAQVGGLESFRMVEPAPSPRAIIEAYREIADAPSYANCDAARAAVAALEGYLAGPRDLASLRTCFAGASKLSKTARGMGKDEKAAVDAVRAARTAFFADAYLACRREALDQIMPLAREVEAEYRALKRERAELDNDDLLTRAYDALRDDPRVRAELSHRFRMVMVDEFQDTAQQQVELVRLLCSDDGRELCTVGDAQQSIYRFRGADVSVFRAKRDEVARGGGVLLDLDTNFRSHAQILAFADAIFGGEGNRLGRDFLHLDSCGEAKRRGARHLRSDATSRRQAVLVVGGTAEERVAARARAIAARFRRLVDEEGFAPGDMVILMRGLTKADVYARAVRQVGLPCVVSGGTAVFRDAPEVAVVGSLLAFLANEDDGQDGIAPLLASPLFALGATELLALATCRVETSDGSLAEDTRTVTGEVLAHGEILPDFGELPLLDRARAILSRARDRVGRDPVAQIARDVVAESGWLARLEEGGAQEGAVAANVLRALAIAEEEGAGRAYSPRLVARAFADHIAHVKESPATLSGAGAEAVRIMTVHASKGLEFPVVAVAELDGIQTSRDGFYLGERAGTTWWAARPNRFEPASDKELMELPALDEDELASPEVPASAARALAYLREEGMRLDFDEAARLLYVAVTRAREVCLLTLGARGASELASGHETSLVGDVLARILPEDPVLGLPDLTSDHLAFAEARPGDFELVLMSDLVYPGKRKPNVELSAADYPPASEPEPSGCEPSGHEAPGPEAPVRSVLVVGAEPPQPAFAPPAPPARDSYSYTSIAADLHAAAEDRAPAAAPAEEGECAVPPAAGDPTALGSAFHACAQWLIETGAATVPSERADAIARFWGVTASQRARLDAALARWEASRVRAELATWPDVRAEVPFFSQGEASRASFGSFVEGAIDVLARDPERPGEVLVIDYKTGGSPQETPSALEEKHRLQAEVYADVLKRAGARRVTLVFVRVEVEDPAAPGEPQTVVYRL